MLWAVNMALKRVHHLLFMPQYITFWMKLNWYERHTLFIKVSIIYKRINLVFNFYLWTILWIYCKIKALKIDPQCKIRVEKWNDLVIKKWNGYWGSVIENETSIEFSFYKQTDLFYIPMSATNMVVTNYTYNNTYYTCTSVSSNQPQLIVCVWPMSRLHSKK